MARHKTSKRRRMPMHDGVFWLLEEMGGESVHQAIVEITMGADQRFPKGPEGLPVAVEVLSQLLYIGWLWVGGAESVRDAKERLELAAQELKWDDKEQLWRAPRGGKAETTEVYLLPKAYEEYEGMHRKE